MFLFVKLEQIFDLGPWDLLVLSWAWGLLWAHGIEFSPTFTTSWPKHISYHGPLVRPTLLTFYECDWIKNLMGPISNNSIFTCDRNRPQGFQPKTKSFVFFSPNERS